MSWPIQIDYFKNILLSIFIRFGYVTVVVLINYKYKNSRNMAIVVICGNWSHTL